MKRKRKEYTPPVYFAAEVEVGSRTVDVVRPGDTLDISLKVMGEEDLEIRMIKTMAGTKTDKLYMTHKDGTGKAGFIGTKGTYLISGTDKDGVEHSMVVVLSREDGVTII